MVRILRQVANCILGSIVRGGRTGTCRKSVFRRALVANVLFAIFGTQAYAGSIGNFVWQDTNGNGIQNGEPGFGGVEVQLQNCAGHILETATTAIDGSYTFDNLAAGRYRIQFVAPAGYSFSPRERGSKRGRDSDPFADTGLTPCKRLGGNQTRSGIDAGLIAEAPTAQPNVVMIIIDDLNDYTGLMGGHPQTLTPNIDALSQQGVWFRNAHAAAPRCNPSRAAMLTGISPRRSGIVSNGGDQALRARLPAAVTLNKAFRDAGYFVAGYGKVYHDDEAEIDDWDISPLGVAMDEPPDPRHNGLELIGTFDWAPLDVADAQLPDHQNTTSAIDFLRGRENDPQPFFLTLGLYRPHLAWYCPRPYFDRIASSASEVVLPPLLATDLNDVGDKARRWAASLNDNDPITSAGKQREAVHAYLACTHFADTQVGRLMDHLDESPLADDTVVVLVSDHGWHLGEKHTWRKFKLWEEDTRVPFVVRMPNGAARVENRSVNISAIYPTLLEMAGIPLPYSGNDALYHIDYRSLVPLLEGAPWSGPAVTFSATNDVSIRSRRYRFTLYSDGFVELYDHFADPNEWHNIAGLAQHRNLVNRRSNEARRYLNLNHQPF